MWSSGIIHSGDIHKTSELSIRMITKEFHDNGDGRGGNQQGEFIFPYTTSIWITSDDTWISEWTWEDKSRDRFRTREVVPRLPCIYLLDWWSGLWEVDPSVDHEVHSPVEERLSDEKTCIVIMVLHVLDCGSSVALTGHSAPIIVDGTLPAYPQRCRQPRIWRSQEIIRTSMMARWLRLESLRNILKRQVSAWDRNQLRRRHHQERERENKRGWLREKSWRTINYNWTK